MRLYNIYYLCNSSLDTIKNIHIEKKMYGQSGEYNYQIEEWDRLFACYKALNQINFLKEDIEKIFELIETHKDLPNDILTITPNVTEKYEKCRKNIISKMEFIIGFYKSLDVKEIGDGIDIKIPKCNSFNEYVEYMKDIEFILSQCPLISQCDETIDFNTVDIGSMWLSFFIKAKAGSHIILSTVSKMVDIALKIRLNTIVAKQQEEVLESMRQKNEIGVEVLDGFKKMKKAMLDESVRELEDGCGRRIKDPEDRDRTARSLEVLSEIIDKGVEIYSAIGVSKEIREKFPFQEDALKLPEGVQELIEEKGYKVENDDFLSDEINYKSYKNILLDEKYSCCLIDKKKCEVIDYSYSVPTPSLVQSFYKRNVDSGKIFDYAEIINENMLILESTNVAMKLSGISFSGENNDGFKNLLTILEYAGFSITDDDLQNKVFYKD